MSDIEKLSTRIICKMAQIKKKDPEPSKGTLDFVYFF